MKKYRARLEPRPHVKSDTPGVHSITVYFRDENIIQVAARIESLASLLGWDSNDITSIQEVTK